MIDDAKQRSRHVGADYFIAERRAMLDQYDKAKAQTVDDHVRTEHGTVGEGIIRKWLEQFLPKKFGVAKGYIITHDHAYAGPLEEWDVIIYDRLESPVLLPKGEPEKLAIPVEHVRGVLEVKATLTPSHAAAVREKLLRLRDFVGENENGAHPKFLRQPFVSSAIFLETAVKNGREFSAALDELLPLFDAGINTNGFLILRSQTHPEHAAFVQFELWKDSVDDDIRSLGTSTFQPVKDGAALLACFSWTINHFSLYVFDLLGQLNGTPPLRQSRKLPSRYGLTFSTEGSVLFTPQEW